ncbi:MAG: ABC transporter permease [Actinobacteria bacterium]|nr:ABC transporter permease [Actinomycetota bacterium]
MIGQVFVTEFAKLRGSAVPWVTLAAMLCGPAGIALFMWIVLDPARAASLGLLGTKANLAGLEATWPAFAGYLPLVVGGSGLLLLAFIVAHLYGREYADDTSKNMLGLPVARGWFVVGKLAVAAVWWLVLAVAAIGEAFVLGTAMGLPGLTTELGVRLVTATLLTAGASFLVCPIVAWITIWARGYLAALGFAIGMLALGDLVSHTGWAPWFPWAIVLTGMATPGDLAWASVLVLLAAFAAGLAATVLRLVYADNP